MSLTLRTWLRYGVPLTLLSALVLSPLAYIALRVPAPADVPHARAAVRAAWVLATAAIGFQLLLVAAAAPLARGLASGAPLSQLRALTAGAASLGRMLVPWAVAIAAVLLGGLALVVPGALVLVLVSLTGASERTGEPPAGPIGDSIAVVRDQLPRVALVVVAIVALNLAIAYAAQWAFVPHVGKKAAAAKLVPIRTFVRVTVAGLIAIAPFGACALAAAYSHAKRR